MKFKKLISALTLGTALSSIALGIASCSNVEERPTTVEGFDETQNYDSKERVNLQISECTLAIRSTFVIPIEKAPGDVKYTFTSSDGVIAKVVADTGFVVAISEGDATIYIKGSDNTYGEFIVHVRPEPEDNSTGIGNIQGSDGTNYVTPGAIKANCADSIVVSRNEALMIEFSFDIDIDKISEAHKFNFAYSLEVDREALKKEAGEDVNIEEIQGGTEALRWGGRLNRYLTINDGTRLLPAGPYILSAVSNTLSKTIKITVSDDILVTGVDIIGNNGYENIITIDGYRSQTITPIFSPWAAKGSSYTLTPVDSTILSVDHTDLGGSAVITGKSVGSTYVRLDVGKEGDANHFRRYIPVTIKEVRVETFGGFRIWPHLKTSTQLRENPNNCTINGSNPKIQAMVVPSNATTIRNSSTCIAYNIRTPGSFGTLNDEDYDVQSSANDNIEDDSYEQAQMEISGSSSASVKDYKVYDNGVIEFDITTSIEDFDDDHKDRWKNSNYLSGGLRTGWALTVISLDTYSSVGSVDTWKTKADLSKSIISDYYSNDETKYRLENSANPYDGVAEYSFAVTRETDSEVNSGDKVSYKDDGSKFKLSNALGDVDEANFVSEFNNNIYKGNMATKRQSLPVVYLVIPQSQIDESAEGGVVAHIFNNIIFDNVPKATIDVKSSDYTNIVDVRIDKEDKEDPIKYNGTKYVQKRFLHKIQTRGIDNISNFVLVSSDYGTWKFLDMDEKAEVDIQTVFQGGGGDFKNRTWFLYAIDKSK